MAFELHHGDCRKIVPTLTTKIDALITDPPYGCKNDNDYRRFTGGRAPSRNYEQGILGDDQPFDPQPWLHYRKVVLFGYHYFAARLPLGSVLVWNKHRPSQLGKWCSDCELAWMKGGHGVYLFNHTWRGFDRESERREFYTPTQKPVALMRWVIEKQKLKAGATILDPFVGSGATGIAALQLGFNFIGIEANEAYYNIARQRLNEAALS